MREVKLKKLEELFEAGLISKKEYEKKKKEIEDMPEEKTEEKKEEVEDVKLKSDKTLIVGAIIIILLFAAVFGLRHLTPEEQPKTIDELHELNLKGKLKPEQGYLYKDVYSFVMFDELWYTQMMSPKGTKLYNVQFRYGPREVENINIGGSLNTELLNTAADYYVTFNPTGNNFSSVALAVGDFNTHMTKIFFKKPIAACDKNETDACINRPIITCGNTDKVVLYVKEANNSRVYFDDNCIVVEGSGFDLVKGVDRILYDFYKIIE
ncbi:MAG: hypothetical protein QGI89_01450 [Candidatus Woesearchaeota archaeon]|jgi:hypothetical protein|nr:hypothetical protein [Candidatus Woesearchaeota archaeon]MDP7322688.1 hypothetical protein [Candidatus Woesearchaeota archaeon]